jgi:restriction system protein
MGIVMDNSNVSKSNEKIPRFDEFLAPILRFAADGQEHTLSETISKMAVEFKLSDGQLNLLMPNRNRTYIYDRVAWAITYLVQAGLLTRTGRSKYKISELGKEEVKTIPDKITYKYLEKFVQFQKFKESWHKKERHMKDQEEFIENGFTPDEEIERIFKMKSDLLANDLIRNLITIKPSDFERVIIDLMLSLGYGKNFEEMAKVLGQPNDQGIDGEISLDKLGFEKIYLQAKRYNPEHPITASEIRDFIGALTTKANAHKGVFITTSKFTKEAIETARRDTNHSIILIDGTELAKLMIENNIGIREIKGYKIKELDKDYFESL